MAYRTFLFKRCWGSSNKVFIVQNLDFPGGYDTQFLFYATVWVWRDLGLDMCWNLRNFKWIIYMKKYLLWTLMSSGKKIPPTKDPMPFLMVTWAWILPINKTCHKLILWHSLINFPKSGKKWNTDDLTPTIFLNNEKINNSIVLQTIQYSSITQYFIIILFYILRLWDSINTFILS